MSDPIAVGAAVERFTNDPTIQEVFADLVKTYFLEWTKSTEVSAREAIFAKVSAVEDLHNALKSLVDAGAAETARNEMIEKLEAMHRENPGL